MDPATILLAIGAVAGALLGIGVIWTQGLKPLYRFGKRLDEANTIILTFPEWTGKIQDMHKELHPNGGSSMKDKIDLTHTLIQDHINDSTRHN